MRHRPVFRHDPFQLAQRIAIAGIASLARPLPQKHLALARLENEMRIGTEERVTRKAAALFHRLEKEGVPPRVDLLKRRDRRFHVGDDLPVNRDEIAPRGQGAKLLARREQAGVHGAGSDPKPPTLPRATPSDNQNGGAWRHAPALSATVVGISNLACLTDDRLPPMGAFGLSSKAATVS